MGETGAKTPTNLVLIIAGAAHNPRSPGFTENVHESPGFAENVHGHKDMQIGARTLQSSVPVMPLWTP